MFADKQVSIRFETSHFFVQWLREVLSQKVQLKRDLDSLSHDLFNLDLQIQVQEEVVAKQVELEIN